MSPTFWPIHDQDQRRNAKQKKLARRAAFVNLPCAQIWLAAAACVLLRTCGLLVDPEHRWWLPVSLLQGRDNWFVGEAIILSLLLPAVSLLRRMVRANEWEEVLVLVVALFGHCQLVMPWGREGVVHSFVSFGVFLAYVWLLLQSGWRNRSRALMLLGVGMLLVIFAAAAALQARSMPLFGVLEHVLLAGLLLGFQWYDCELVADALQREAHPETCRLNNFGPPFM